MKARRKVYLYGKHFQEFYITLDMEEKKKVDWVIGLVCDLDVVPSKFFKKIKGTVGLYEIRVMVRRNIFRIFCFFDDGSLIILLHGMQKKTQKIPLKEIAKANQLRKEYYEQKSK
ncbi:MAG: type II toxin-antitoxin system RelE/ParE family toxin [Bacteroidota bacterium]|nr:type II toxin-antitoxin system RelE/ParE family toxin [Bacteroidota bacterium]